MQLRKLNIDPNQTINYFVHNKIKSGEAFSDNEEWAKEWLQQYVSNSSKKEEKLYNARHTIPQYVEVWEERLNKKPPAIKSIRDKIQPIDFSQRKRAKELLEKYRYSTVIPFEELKPEEYVMIANWFDKKEEIPDYLKGILKYKLTIEEKIQKLLGKSLRDMIVKSQDYVFYLFLAFFFTILMLINL